MLALLDGRASASDLRRDAVACCRRFLDRLPSEQRHRALALAEQMADDPVCAASHGLEDVDTKQGPADCACDVGR
jgi:hypothetical protein